MSTESSPSPALAGTGPIDVACPICATVLSEPTGLIERDLSGRCIQFRTCGTCGVLVPTEVEPWTTDEDLSPTASVQRSPEAMAGDAPRLAWELAEHLPPPSTSSPVVDLGMGRGALPNALRNLGYAVTGCEPSAFLCQVARASHLLGPSALVNTDADTFLDGLEERSETAAAVILRHVVGRHPDPVGLLRRCGRLAPDGVLLVEFPIAAAGELSGEQRIVPTPATLLHLAETIDLLIASAVVDAESTLRASYRVPTDGVVDLDRQHRIDLPTLEAVYRVASPAFASVSPGAGPGSIDDQDAVDTVDERPATR